MEPHKRAKYSKSLDPDKTEEVLMDEESDEELEDRDKVMEPHVQSSASSEDEDDAEETEVAFWATRAGDSSNFLNFTGPPNGFKGSAAPNINAESPPFSIFILFFRQVFQIILTETNCHFHQYMSSRTTGSTSAQPPDITIEEMNTFFGLIIQMGHDQPHSLKDYWSRQEYCTPFYSNVMARNRFFQLLRFLHFENNDDPDYDWLWKIRKIFDTLNNKFCELYNPTEHLPVDEVIVLHKGRVVFRQYIPKKHKRFGIKIYKLCNSLGYTYDTSVYLDKQRQHATAQITATHRTALGTGPQNFHGQLFHLACSVWWSVPTKNQCVWNSSPWQVWNATRYWTKISKNGKGGHSNTSQGNPKACSLERQAGCVHSDKHARSPWRRKFHPRIWPGYQTSCWRRLHCIHGVCGQVRQNGQQLWNCPQNMEVDQENVFFFI